MSTRNEITKNQFRHSRVGVEEEGFLAPEFLRGYTLSGGTDLVTRPSFIHGYGFRVTVVQGSLSACFAPRDDNNVEIYGSMVLLGDLRLWRLIYPFIL